MPLEDYAYVLPLRMPFGISVVLDVSCLRRVNGVIAAHGAIFAWIPMCAALAEDDVARDHILLCRTNSLSVDDRRGDGAKGGIGV